MSVPSNENQEQIQEKPNDKEYNFAQMRKQLEQERQARQEAEERASKAEKIAQERLKASSDDEDDDDEPYVDKRKLQKKLNKFEMDIEQKIDARAEAIAKKRMDAEKQNQWLRNNPDYQEIMSHAQKFAEMDPELAETILEMPEGFERQKLVYKNIKALGLHKPKSDEPTIQQKIDANRKSPYYQPSGVGSAPYASQGDFSPAGQKNAYDKMRELQKRLRG